MEKNRRTTLYDIANAFYTNRHPSIPNVTIGRQGDGERGYLSIFNTDENDRYIADLQISRRGLGKIALSPDGSIEVLEDSPEWFSPQVARNGLEKLFDLK